MALKAEMEGNVLHVTQTTHGWRKDFIEHWYYDLETWQRSLHGKFGDKPVQAMEPVSIEWVKKYYLPLLPKGE